MFRCRVAPIWALFFVLFIAPSAQAFWEAPYVTPEAPRDGEAVSINVRIGVCDVIANREGFPRITRNGNQIRLVVYGQHWEPGELCTFPTGTGTFSLGSYPRGDYVVTFDLFYLDFFSQPQVLHLGIVPFTVAGNAQAPIAIPGMDAIGAVALTLLIVGFALRRLCLKPNFLLVLLVCCLPCVARAQSAPTVGTIEVLLSSAPGAPTPEQVVAWLYASPRSSTPPLIAFSVKTPLGGNHLIPDRATGDFLSWLNSNPNSARRKLEDIVLTTFPVTDVPAALAALQADPYVVSARELLLMQPSSVTLTEFSVDPNPLGNGDQYGWYDLRIDAAWRLAGGYALVGQIDNGLFEQHPSLRQFDGNAYVGGNFIKAASKDVSLTGLTPPAGFDFSNVDEAKPLQPTDPLCSSSVPVGVGHGTHVAGLLSANGISGQGVEGTCKHCGLSVWKVGQPSCIPSDNPPQVHLLFNTSGSDRGQAQAIDTGVQVESLSFGASSIYAGITYCFGQRNSASCLALAYAKGRDIAAVASSGNDRKDLNFPASDPRTIAAGGYEPNVALWDESPGSNTHCPYISPNAPVGAECGTNRTVSLAQNGFNRQELMASAKSALSTTYPHKNWVDYARCGDQYQVSGTAWGNGVGLCTGTSMSAPQIAGLVALLRSVNPLAPIGVPEPASGTASGLRSVLARTTVEAQSGQAWTPTFGYGHPDAEAAVRKVLGTAAGATVRNRVTPLFRMWQAVTRDFAETSSPQYALSLMINQDKNYVQPVLGLGTSSLVPGYAFPYDANDSAIPNDGTWEAAPAAPRAAIYVLTTEYRPRNEWPDLRPLHLMDKNAKGGKDYLIATTTTEIETAHAAGYNLRTVQGYIYQPCLSEPACIPPGAQKLWRQYKAADNDCVVFLESERTTFEANGYTSACPAGATRMIGYAYPATDADPNTKGTPVGDGLPDGFEYVIGTNPSAADSDGDGIVDAVEFPLAGIATVDPCMGGTLGARNCGADRVFENGFDGL